MLKQVKASFSFRYGLTCLRAFKVIRNREGEKEVFKHLATIQRIKLFFQNNIIARSLGYRVPNEFSEALSQKLFRESLDSYLSSLVMIARYGHKKAVFIPYPKPWRQYLRSIGLRPHNFSILLFGMMLIGKLKEAIRELIVLLNYKMDNQSKIKKYISFIGVPEAATMESLSSEPQYNFLTYAQSKFPGVHILFAHRKYAQINNLSDQGPYPFLPLTSIKERGLFLITSLGKCLLSILSLLVGQWAYMYMLKDAIIDAYVARLNQTKLPKKIIFLNSCYVYKPLWAIDIEKRGVEVALMFYATNTYDIHFTGDTYGIVPGYEGMTWNTFYTLHVNHKEFIRRMVKRRVCVHVEATPFSLTDQSAPLNLPSGRKIALFDIQPFRDAFLASIGRPTNIYTYAISEEIFSDLVEWCEKNEVFLVIKPKRDVHRRLCPRYAALMQRYAKKEWCIVVDHMYSPKRICQQVDAVVCQPFTSAALFSVSEKKPVTYYDPVSPFILDQPANQEIPLRNTREDLYEFLDRVVLHS